MITFVFSMMGPQLSDSQASAFRAYAQWRVVNERNGRLLVDGIGEADNLLTALGALTAMGRDPIAIGAWEQDGTPIEGYTLNEAAWLDVAPDDYDMTDPENPVAVRPTEWRDIHRWAGWGEKQVWGSPTPHRANRRLPRLPNETALGAVARIGVQLTQHEESA